MKIVGNELDSLWQNLPRECFNEGEILIKQEIEIFNRHKKL